MTRASTLTRMCPVPGCWSLLTASVFIVVIAIVNFAGEVGIPVIMVMEAVITVAATTAAEAIIMADPSFLLLRV